MKAREIMADLKARDAEGEPQQGRAGNFGPVVMLAQDRTLERLAACFENVPVSTDPDPEEECPASIAPGDRLRWYWARLEPDPIPAWIARSGLPDAPHVRRACATLIDNRMVHPDGVVSRWVKQYLSGQVKMLLGGRGG